MFVFGQTARALRETGSVSPSSCHMRELDLCVAGVLVFTQSPNGLATNEKEMQKQCTHLNETNTCLKQYTNRCMTPLQRDIVTMVSNSSMDLLGEYCHRGSQLRVQYLKHAQCLNQVQKKEQKTCVRDAQNVLELLTSNDHNQSGSLANKRIQLACCGFKRFEDCFQGHIEKRCGKEAWRFVVNVVRRATSRMPEIMCRNYKPDGNECRSLLPKSGLSPRGHKSSSVLSRLLSAYTGS